jgi:hypothetical protein
MLENRCRICGELMIFNRNIFDIPIWECPNCNELEKQIEYEY